MMLISSPSPAEREVGSERARDGAKKQESKLALSNISRSLLNNRFAQLCSNVNITNRMTTVRAMASYLQSRLTATD